MNLHSFSIQAVIILVTTDKNKNKKNLSHLKIISLEIRLTFGEILKPGPRGKPGTFVLKFKRPASLCASALEGSNPSLVTKIPLTNFL